MHCRRFLDSPLTRRQMLRQCANGFGALALDGLLSESARGANAKPQAAKSVIFLFMDGGPSQVDTFDPKPRLAANTASRSKCKVAADAVQQRRQGHAVARGSSRQYGQSGIPVSDLFPHVAQLRR